MTRGFTVQRKFAAGAFVHIYYIKNFDISQMSGTQESDLARATYKDVALTAELVPELTSIKDNK